MLTFVLLWLAGVFPVPRCLSGSASCMRLRDNLEQTGWINVLNLAKILLVLTELVKDLGGATQANNVISVSVLAHLGPKASV